MAEKENHPWEVVSLTSSAYAASPGPYNVDARAYYGAESSYMSDHFVFPPSEHENLPIDEPLEQEEHDLSDKLSSYDESSVGSSKGVESLGSESVMYEQGVTDAESVISPVICEKDGGNEDLPCEAWWRKRAVSIYSSTREANAVWSLFFAAAVTGLVVLGQRWQHERWQVLQLKWQSSISSEKLSKVLEPLSRLKDVIVRSNPQAALVRSGASSEM